MASDADDAASDAGSQPAPVVPPAIRKSMAQLTPQEAIDKFWKRYSSSSPAKVFTVLPQHQHSTRQAESNDNLNDEAKSGEPVSVSYNRATAECKAKVEKIVKECFASNQKYRDPHFDMERYRWVDGKWFNDCLMGLGDDELGLTPQGVKRIGDIFDDPKFYVEDATASDIRQGRDGDCWFLSALSTLSCVKDLIDRVCVARNEKVGVYGFVFHRDGEWFSEIIDDKLYLTKPDFDDLTEEERSQWNEQYRKDPEEEYRKAFQSGSQALYFAQCNDFNETWLPLLEKAYAKAHGDFAAIDGG